MKMMTDTAMAISIVMAIVIELYPFSLPHSKGHKWV